ncbi:hypothetical protein GCK32_015840 [Trichostrongylus colubriformis]|uniref:7TM GPCR serpentine receptor class x (Srx) domain-containing protein n=1 Tax=Trichostrongylus colubriformis TaxID=6319 RepID=A0AAN8FAP8_TRICO
MPPVADDGESVAVLSYANIMISSSVINCGHVVIALNRWTAIYKPQGHAKIWRRSTIFISVFGLWLIFITYSLVLIVRHRGTIASVMTKDGEFVVTSTMLDRTFSIVNCVRGATTVALCSIFYTSALIKCRRTMQAKTDDNISVFGWNPPSTNVNCVQVLRKRAYGNDFGVAAVSNQQQRSFQAE